MTQSQKNIHITRLAPSPTGALHMGNARTFLINFLIARQRNWRILMRMEDIDSPRVKPWAAQQALDDLEWMKITWDETVSNQSDRNDAYLAALENLTHHQHAYPCVCSRKDIQQAGGAPHNDDHITVYPGTCRGKYASAQEATRLTGRPAAWRVRAGSEPIVFTDGFAGRQEIDLASSCGDFVVFRNEGLAGYQLAVVVDDCEQGVDVIVRGDDLLDSAARQIHMRRCLGGGPEPEYWHVPLVTGPDGRRLAKRHGDTRLSHYRDIGVRPERVLGLLGFLCGMIETPREMDMPELLDTFDLSQLPSGPVIFDEACEQFLLS
ncbi:MAG: tRNA glutamyl-Q(34) synthetase GluQRS [Phycisphaerales bacterium]|jgi:glutamyl-tRNA synthetase|nr:tRNA glutamyl-Q(34) synthetase GluQRS [Phycisphaerales bacterium]